MHSVRSTRWTALALVSLIGVIFGAGSGFSDNLLDPLSQPKFVNPLPIPSVIDATGGGYFEVSISQFEQELGLYDPMTGDPLQTTVWGYNGSYPGPTFVAQKDVAIDVLWKNELVDAGGMPLYHLLPVDTSLHWAHPMGWPASGVPVVTHLHGGHTESASDGLPDAWFSPGFAITGADFVKQVYTYDNDQEAGTLWYHDHALGITRLNVYAGLAGFYLLRDENEEALIEGGYLPTGPYEIGLAIQDRMFTADGELYYPSEPEIPGAPEPSVLPEFFGDVILVNGAAWPVLEVEPRLYRFRFLNGSDSRFYNLWLAEKFDDQAFGGSKDTNRDLPGMGGDNGFDDWALLPSDGGDPEYYFYQIGTDDGLLDAPVMRNRLVFGPGERLDVVIDFSDEDMWGGTFVLRNNARSPFPKGDVVGPRTTGQIMAFRVNRPLNPDYPVTTLPTDLRPVHGPIEPLMQTGSTRELLLFEGTDEYGRLRPQLGTAADGALLWDDPITENPMVDDVEVWTVYNATEDAHPIHLHLVAFQILDRQKFKAGVDPLTGALSNIQMIGQPKPVGPDEWGWKDTAIMYPGEATRVIAKFDRVGEYVWHCHILSHEDHEMMRPYEVVEPGSPMVAMREAGNQTVTRVENYPNPFKADTEIRFQLAKDGQVDLKVYNLRGQEIRTLLQGVSPAGTHRVRWDGKDNAGRSVASGVYFYRLKSGSVDETAKMILARY